MKPIDFVVHPAVFPYSSTYLSNRITFFCRHCSETKHHHLDDDKCVFSSTTFAYEPHALIAQRMAEEEFAGKIADSREIAVFLKATLAYLQRSSIPNFPENEITCFLKIPTS